MTRSCRAFLFIVVALACACRPVETPVTRDTHTAVQAPTTFVESILDALKATSVPILHAGGDHDISLPVENWYALNRQLPTLQLLTFPRVGHGPQHQFPAAIAEHIGIFVRPTSKS